jgi:hypothetical protein
MSILVTDPDPKVAVLAHDIRVIFDVCENPQATANHCPHESFRGDVDSAALGTT